MKRMARASTTRNRRDPIGTLTARSSFRKNPGETRHCAGFLKCFREFSPAGQAVPDRAIPAGTAEKWGVVANWWQRNGSFVDVFSKPEARYPVYESGVMHTAKETVRRLLDDLPDNASLEDIQYHIYVREKIERGLRDVEAGRVVDQDEAKRRMAKWLGE
jgi:hypothetical protein